MASRRELDFSKDTQGARLENIALSTFSLAVINGNQVRTYRHYWPSSSSSDSLQKSSRSSPEGRGETHSHIHLLHPSRLSGPRHLSIIHCCVESAADEDASSIILMRRAPKFINRVASSLWFPSSTALRHQDDRWVLSVCLSLNCSGSSDSIWKKEGGEFWKCRLKRFLGFRVRFESCCSFFNLGSKRREQCSLYFFHVWKRKRH